MDNIQIQLVKPKLLSNDVKKEFLQERYDLGTRFYENPDDTIKSLEEIKSIFKQNTTYFIIFEQGDKKIGSMLGKFCSHDGKKLFDASFMCYDDTTSSDVIIEIVLKIKKTCNVENIYGLVNKHSGGMIDYFEKFAHKHDLLFGEDPNIYTGLIA